MNGDYESSLQIELTQPWNKIWQKFYTKNTILEQYTIWKIESSNIERLSDIQQYGTHRGFSFIQVGHDDEFPWKCFLQYQLLVWKSHP